MEGVEAALSDEDLVGSLTLAPQAWAGALATLLQSPAQAPPQQHLPDLLGEALRSA